jgi:hypothetical protein
VTVHQVVDYLREHPEVAQKARDYVKAHPDDVKAALGKPLRSVAGTRRRSMPLSSRMRLARSLNIEIGKSCRFVFPDPFPEVSPNARARVLRPWLIPLRTSD